MRLGDGVNTLRDIPALPAVVVNKDITVDAGSFPTKLTVEHVNDLSRLRNEVKTTAGLAAKLNDLGLTLDVSLERSNRIDARHDTYIFKLESTEKTERISGPPPFNKNVLTMLGLDHSPDNDPGNTKVDESVFCEFSKTYGTAYVDEVRYGWQFFAVVKFDSTKMCSEAKTDVSVAAQGGVIAETQVNVNSILRRENENAVLNIRVCAEGYDLSSVKVPQTLKELDDLLSALTDEKMRPKSGVISYKTRPYDALFRIYKVPSPVVDCFSSALQEGNNCLDALYKLRSKVVKLYARRYLHKGIIYPITNRQVDNTLKMHPYTQRVDYLLGFYKKIIREIDRQIGLVNYCNLDKAVISAAQVAHKKLDQMSLAISRELLLLIENRLVSEKRLFFAADQKHIDFTRIILHMPPGTAFLAMVVLNREISHDLVMPELPDLSKIDQEDVGVSTVGAKESTQSLESILTEGVHIKLKEYSRLADCCTPDLLDNFNSNDHFDPDSVNKMQLGLCASRADATNPETWTVSFFVKKEATQESSNDKTTQSHIKSMSNK